MKKKLRYFFSAFFILIICFGLLNSCQRDNLENDLEKSFVKDTGFTVAKARAYHSSHFSKNFILSSSLKTMNDKTGKKSRLAGIHKIWWSMGKSFHNGSLEMVEAPIYIEKRTITAYGFGGTSHPEIPDIAVARAAFMRYVIFKRKNGTVDRRILTYMPNKDYIAKYGMDASKNSIGHLEKNFSGYIEFTSSDFKKRLFLLQIESGKIKRKIYLDALPNSRSVSNIKEQNKSNIKTLDECPPDCYPNYEMQCHPEANQEATGGYEMDCGEEQVEDDCYANGCAGEDPNNGYGDPCNGSDAYAIPECDFLPSDPPTEEIPEKTYVTETIPITPPDVALDDEDYETVYNSSTNITLPPFTPVQLKIKPTFYLVTREYPGGIITAVDQHNLEVDPVYSYYVDKYGRSATRYAQLQFQTYGYTLPTPYTVTAWWSCNLYRRYTWAGVPDSRTINTPYNYTTSH